MPNIYITDQTRANLEAASKADKRTLTGEIEYLCEQRLKTLRDENYPSVNDEVQATNSIQQSQGKNDGE